VTPINYLLTSDEQRGWHKNNFPRDLKSRFDGARLYAMTVFQTCSWIFLFDPDDQARLWIAASIRKMRETLTLMERESMCLCVLCVKIADCVMMLFAWLDYLLSI